jgi:GntR family transcriptional regulator
MGLKPAYARMYDALKKDIYNGEYAVGDLLPAEPELEKRFNVSRTTVRRAVDLLSREGLVSAKQGRGTQVLDYKTTQNLNTVSSISETLRQKGYEITSKGMQIDITGASHSVAKQLGINDGDKLVRIQRIQLADGKPVAIMRNFILPEKVPGIEKYVNKFSSLYEFLEERYSINIDSARDSISARCADFDEAAMLSVELGSAILYMRRITFEDGVPVSAVGLKNKIDYFFD